MHCMHIAHRLQTVRIFSMASIVEEAFTKLQIPQKFLPDREPQKPASGFTFRVSFPYASAASKQNVVEAIDKSTISSATAPVDNFETELKKFFSVPFAKACSNGFSALLLALKLANVGKKDDVLMPSFTMVAVANSVLSIEANPIFVDSESADQVNPSVEQFQSKITRSTKALIVTHTYGIPADIQHLVELCSKHNIVLIEDIAEAIGVEYGSKKLGTFGDFACSSLYANKFITSGDGGFVLSRHNGLENLAKSYINHGFTEGYHFVHVEHSGNYKMSGLQAAFVAPAVHELPIVLNDRKRIAEMYRKYLDKASGVKMMPKSKHGPDTPWVFGILVESKKKKKEVRQCMANDGIETRDFFFPLHLQPLIVEKYGFIKDQFPNAEFLAAHGLYLPTYFGLKDADIKYICDCLLKYL